MSENQNEPKEPIKGRTAKVDYSHAVGGRFYANHMVIGATLFDARIIFSDVDISGESLSANQTMTVLMAPELAFMLHKALGNFIESYEPAYGKLRLSEERLAQMHATSKPPVDPE